MPKIIKLSNIHDQAEEAEKFYTSDLPNSHITGITRISQKTYLYRKVT